MLLAEYLYLIIVEMRLTGTDVDQKLAGEYGSLRVGCRNTMWQERRNRHILVSKQQQKY